MSPAGEWIELEVIMLSEINITFSFIIKISLSLSSPSPFLCTFTGIQICGTGRGTICGRKKGKEK